MKETELLDAPPATRAVALVPAGNACPAPAPSAVVMSFQDVVQMAQMVCASGLFGYTSVDQALALMMICQADGLHPMQAMRRYHIIKGRPSMRADAMQAEFQRRGGVIEFHQRDNQACEATFTRGYTSARVRFSVQDARSAGLTVASRNGEPSMWDKYPRQMCHARCISEGITAVDPATKLGMYAPEEVAQFNGGPALVSDFSTTAQTGIVPSTETTPTNDVDEEKQRFAACMRAFIIEGRRLGLLLPASKPKDATSLLQRLADDMDPRNAEHWAKGTELLADYQDANEQAEAVAEMRDPEPAPITRHAEPETPLAAAVAETRQTATRPRRPVPTPPEPDDRDGELVDPFAGQEG